VPATTSSSSRGSSEPSLAAVPRLAGPGAGSAPAHAITGAAALGTALASSTSSAGASANHALATTTARDAVETVVKLADAQMARSEVSPSAVNLGFKFGDDHLGVRVEIRSGQVHTQFTTSSPELRDALSTQFAALTAGAGAGSSNSGGGSDRPYQFTAPQFSGSPATGDQSGSPRQNSPQTPAEFALEGFGRGARSARSNSSSLSDPTPAPANLADSGGLRLHAFA
jgi:hypothetical protein